ncbi:MAG: F0F1 ATP synthase subunit alpha [Anaerolineaceae bacterium]|nr:F0F1 ATP synthase subunit alpha [Anaerolineaceae bacterium]
MSESRLNEKHLSRINVLREKASERLLIEKDDQAFTGLQEQLNEKAKKLKPSPRIKGLTRLVKNDLARVSSNVKFKEVGTVQHIGNGVATLSGLPQVRTDGLVEFSTGVRGLILNLDHDHLDVILLGPDEGISGGDMVTSVGEQLRIPVGPKAIGRVLNPLGEPLDEQGPVFASDHWVLERMPPGIVEREPVHEPLQTGIKHIDALLPIGKGQRELIVGDRQTGKTSVAVDAILAQKGQDVYCIYVAIGQKKSTTLDVYETLRANDSMKYTTIVMSSPDDPPALRYLAPYAGCTLAEYLLKMGRDVLIVYDDLTKHADAYRELSLLLRRPPGREAYPGDIFYLHSRLLERACKVKDGASITALPIVITQRGNISAYIPTNLISITDGQIVLDADQFNRGIKPAVDVGKSVSRVGGAAQTQAMRELSGDVRLQLAQYEEVARFSRFGTDVDLATKRQIETGQRLQAILKQNVHMPLSLGNQILSMFAVVNGHLNDISIADVTKFEEAMHVYFDRYEPQIEVEINQEGVLTEKLKEEIQTGIEKFREKWDEEQAS